MGRMELFPVQSHRCASRVSTSLVHINYPYSLSLTTRKYRNIYKDITLTSFCEMLCSKSVLVQHSYLFMIVPSAQTLLEKPFLNMLLVMYCWSTLHGFGKLSKKRETDLFRILYFKNHFVKPKQALQIFTGNYLNNILHTYCLLHMQCLQAAGN